MSDQTLNNIMCMALIDGKFRDALLANPATVVGDFELDAEEEARPEGVGSCDRLWDSNCCRLGERKRTSLRRECQIVPPGCTGRGCCFVVCGRVAGGGGIDQMSSIRRESRPGAR